MSIIVVNTIEIGGVPTRQKIGLNTEKINILEEREGKAYFQFVPFVSRIERYLIEEGIDHILNAPIQSDNTEEDFITTSGTLTVSKSNVLKVYPHPSVDRTYMQTLSGTEIGVSVIKERMEDVVERINKAKVGAGSVDMDEVGSPDSDGITWDDLRVPAQNTKLNPTKAEPAFESWIDGLFAYHFDNNNGDDESIHFSAQLPHRYKEGSNLHVHVHWSPDNTDTGDVVWELEYTLAPIIAGVFPASETLTATVTASGIDNGHIISELGVIDGSELGISSMLICRLTRLGTDPGDDFTGNVVFLEIDFHYQQDMTGSRQEYVK